MPRISSCSITSRISDCGTNVGSAVGVAPVAGAGSPFGAAEEVRGSVGAAAVEAAICGEGNASTGSGLGAGASDVDADSSRSLGAETGFTAAGAGSMLNAGSGVDTGAAAGSLLSGSDSGAGSAAVGVGSGPSSSEIAAADSAALDADTGGGLVSSAAAATETGAVGRFRLQKIKPIPRTSTARIVLPARAGRRTPGRFPASGGSVLGCGTLWSIACATVLRTSPGATALDGSC